MISKRLGISVAMIAKPVVDSGLSQPGPGSCQLYISYQISSAVVLKVGCQESDAEVDYVQDVM